MTGTELKILQAIIGDQTHQYSIRGISKELKMLYPQVHKAVQVMLEKELLISEKQGKNIILSLDARSVREEYIIAELERKRNVLDKHPILQLVEKDFEKMPYSQFICVLFGSYALGKAKKDSDIDLLFVIPEEYDYGAFEKAVRNCLTVPRLDINITTGKGLMEMWNTPLKLNVGNELLSRHIILRGAEQFLYLRRRYNFG